MQCDQRSYTIEHQRHADGLMDWDMLDQIEALSPERKVVMLDLLRVLA